VTRALYFEDFKPGDRFESAALTLTEALIVEYARFYDPQPFHTDPEAAKATVFGGLIASGMQTIAIGFKLFFNEFIEHPGPGPRAGAGRTGVGLGVAEVVGGGTQVDGERRWRDRHL